MTISRITPSIKPTTPEVEPVHGAPAQEPVAARAVISVDPVVRITPPRMARPDASFVAHLIAMADHAPQTRVLRRETPAAAQAMYDRAMTKSANGDGRVLSQVA